MNSADAFTLFSQMELVGFFSILIFIDFVSSVWLFRYLNKNSKRIIALEGEIKVIENSLIDRKIASDNEIDIMKTSIKDVKDSNIVFQESIREQLFTLNGQYIKLNASVNKALGMLDILIKQGLVKQEDEDGE